MFKKLFFICCAICSLVGQLSLAQCPQPASCTPGGPLPANLVFGCGITNVIFGSINRSSGLASQGYQDISCTIGANIIVGVPSTITINTNPNVQENVRVWIDLNNDGQFGATTELVFSSNNAFVHTGNITLPANTALDTALRMRVMAEVNGAPDAPASNLQPCYTPLYSQVEDYRVRALPNTQPPLALFTASDTITCNGQIQFTDQTVNTPTSWNWSFGDGNTSTLQNPLHTYLPGGPYTVRLIVSNTQGIDTLIRNNYISYNSQAPIAATCTPATVNYCCGYGITNFTLSTLSRNSGNGSEGYRNFTCAQSLTVTEGLNYPVNISTGTLAADTRIWIDYNNNGAFSANELVFTRTNSINASGNLVFSDTSIVYNTPLRLRVISDFVGSSYTACNGIVHGQAEDYTVVIAPNVAAPIANFTSNFNNACNPVIQFTNTTVNAVASYLWRFGDGNTSTLKDPLYTYTTPGTYSVTLIVTSPFGVDSITKANLITFAGTVSNAACTPTTNGTSGGVGITRFRFGTIDRTSPGATEGYSNQVCSFLTEMVEGQSYQIIVNTGPNFPENVRAWIDYNGDGAFLSAEQVFNSTASTIHTGNITLSTTSVKNQLLRLRVVSSFNTINTAIGCGTIQFGQGEDYGIIIRPNNIPPIPNFATTDLNPCNGGARFTNTTFGNVSSYKWFFGDGDSSTLAVPVKYYTTPGIYTVSLTACNNFGCSTLTRPNYINVAPIVAPPYPVCLSGVSYSCCSVGIASVTIGNMQNTSGNGLEGNRDFTCTRIITDTLGKSINVSIQNSNPSILEDLAIWIDLNNDLLLDTTERVFLSTAKVNHTGSFTISGFAVTNIPLRLRIVSRQSGTAGVLTPCGTVSNGQAEDYTIILRPNTLPPLASFSLPSVTTCNGTVSFTNTSIRNPQTFLWSFGDGNTSSQINPTHVYNGPGTFIVKLVVCNGNGCDSTQSALSITQTDGPKAPSCRPATVAYCCGVGITSFTLGSFTFTSPNAAEGYQDRTCNATFPSLSLSNSSFSMSVSVGTGFPEKVAMWIDFNDNGVFESNELLTSGISSAGSYSATFSISNAPITGKKLRLRVGSDFNDGTPLSPCGPIQVGQFEDYSVFIQPVSSAPVSNFTVNNPLNCTTGAFSFGSTSTNLPTSYLWYFGNGATSTLANPTYTYPFTGIYTVSLKVCNSFGCDSISKPNFVRYVIPCPPTYCSSTGHNNSQRFITSVSFAGFTNNSLQDPQGYGNYTGQLIPVVKGSNYSLTVNAVNPAGQQSVLEVWIDYNANGVFAADEKVLTRNGTDLYFANIRIPTTALNTEIRMRVRFKNLPATTNACTNLLSSAEVEDYTLLVLNVSSKPQTNFTVSKRFACAGETLNFANSSNNTPTGFNWDFGNSLSSTIANPTTIYSTSGSYSVRLITANGFGQDTLIRPNLVQVTSNITPPTASLCAPTVSSTCCDVGIKSFSFAGASWSDTVPASGYQDFTCGFSGAILPDSVYSLQVNLGTGKPLNFSVWIDYNRDLSFTASERVLQLSGVQGLVSQNITVPNSSQLGNMRIRLIADQTAVPADNACAAVNLGNAIDFTLVRGSVSGLNSKPSVLSQVLVYPNPARDVVNITWEEALDIQEIELIDLSGKVLISKQVNEPERKQTNIDLSHLASGTYFIISKSGSQVYRTRMVKD